VIFFSIVINDPQTDYTYYYKSFLLFFIAHFLFTAIGRLGFLSYVKSMIYSGKLKFNTLLTGKGSLMAEIYKDSSEELRASGYHYTGYVTPGAETLPLPLPLLGDVADIRAVVENHKIELVVIAASRK